MNTRHVFSVFFLLATFSPAAPAFDAIFTLNGKYLEIVADGAETVKMFTHVEGIGETGWTGSQADGLPQEEPATGEVTSSYLFKTGETMNLKRTFKQSGNTLEGLEQWQLANGSPRGLIRFEIPLSVDVFADTVISTMEGQEAKIADHMSPEENHTVFSTKTEELRINNGQGKTLTLTFPNGPAHVDVDSWTFGGTSPETPSVSVRIFWPGEIDRFLVDGEFAWSLTVE